MIILIFSIIIIIIQLIMNIATCHFDVLFLIQFRFTIGVPCNIFIHKMFLNQIYLGEQKDWGSMQTTKKKTFIPVNSWVVISDPFSSATSSKVDLEYVVDHGGGVSVHQLDLAKAQFRLNRR